MAGPFPLSPLKRILRKAGAKRVSAGAAESLREVLLEMADELSVRAWKAAQHAGRRTVKREDILISVG